MQRVFKGSVFVLNRNLPVVLEVQEWWLYCREQGWMQFLFSDCLAILDDFFYLPAKWPKLNKNRQTALHRNFVIVVQPLLNLRFKQKSRSYKKSLRICYKTMVLSLVEARTELTISSKSTKKWLCLWKLKDGLYLNGRVWNSNVLLKTEQFKLLFLLIVCRPPVRYPAIFRRITLYSLSGVLKSHYPLITALHQCTPPPPKKTHCGPQHSMPIDRPIDQIIYHVDEAVVFLEAQPSTFWNQDLRGMSMSWQRLSDVEGKG